VLRTGWLTRPSVALGEIHDTHGPALAYELFHAYVHHRLVAETSRSRWWKEQSAESPFAARSSENSSGRPGETNCSTSLQLPLPNRHPATKVKPSPGSA
jgi:hypothetical protein